MHRQEHSGWEPGPNPARVDFEKRWEEETHLPLDFPGGSPTRRPTVCFEARPSLAADVALSTKHLTMNWEIGCLEGGHVTTTKVHAPVRREPSGEILLLNQEERGF